jgi:hypothetical protein
MVQHKFEVELHGPTQVLLKEPGRKSRGHCDQLELWGGGLVLNQWEWRVRSTALLKANSGVMQVDRREWLTFFIWAFVLECNCVF